MSVKNITKNLNSHEKKELLKYLQYEFKSTKLYGENDATFFITKIECPNCNNSDIVNKGITRGRNRYFCNCCKKTFSNFTGKAIAGVKKVEKFQSFVKLVLESVSVRKASDELDLNTTTILKWRHKIASQLVEMNESKAIKVFDFDEAV